MADVTRSKIPTHFSAGDTNESIITFSGLRGRGFQEIIIKMDSSNSGTIKLSNNGVTDSNSHNYAASDREVITVLYRLNVKQTVAGDGFSISY